MDKKVINRILIISGFVSLISGIGYILEKLKHIAETFPFQQILIISLTIFSFLLIVLILILRTKFKLEDLRIIYYVKILNENGDALIKRKVTFKVNKGDVQKREHSAFSDGAKMKQKDLDLKAWDNSGNTLFCKFVLDKPTTKKFELNFPHSITKDNKYTYTYQFLWNKLFSPKNDYYLLQDTSINSEFHLMLPETWKLQCIEAVELFRDGTKKDLQIKPNGKEVDEGGYLTFKYKIKRTERHTQVKVEWHLD